MRGILLLIAITVTILGWSQDNDTALLRKHRVKEVRKNFFVHAFLKDTDTCLISLRKFDERGRIISDLTNLKCMGWDIKEEARMKYQNNLLQSLVIIRNDEPFNTSFYTYQEGRKEPTRIKVLFHQTNDSTLTENKYFFGKYAKPDSTLVTQTEQDGSVIHTKVIARYNEEGEVVQLSTLDSAGNPLEMITYEMGGQGKILSVAHTTYGDKPKFTQTFFDYDQNGRVVSTKNTVNQKQEYFYLPNGLISNIFSYNPEGKLETEYMFDYTYFE